MPQGHREDDRSVRHDLVGVYFSSDVGFDVCEKASNFAGLIGRGEEPSWKTGVGCYALDLLCYDPEKLKIPPPDEQ